MKIEDVKKAGWNKTKVKQYKKELPLVIEKTKKTKEEIFEMTKFNLGLIYGLMFGLIGNLFILIFDRIYLENYEIELLRYIFFILLIFLIYLIIVFIKNLLNNKKGYETSNINQNLLENLQNELNKIEEVLNSKK